MKTEFILPPSIWLLRNGTSYEYLLLRRSLTTMKWRAFVLLSPQSLRYRRAIWHNSLARSLSFSWFFRLSQFLLLLAFAFLLLSQLLWSLMILSISECWEKHAWIARVPHSSRHKRRRLGRSWLAYLCGNKKEFPIVLGVQAQTSLKGKVSRFQ